jgi:putative PIN family toxin of toxin-antitoxin system
VTKSTRIDAKNAKRASAMRATVDSNVWTRAFLKVTGPAGRVAIALLEGRFTLVTSEPLLAELDGVLSRPSLVRKHGCSPEQVAAFVSSLREGGEIVALSGSVHLCRDPDDDSMIETAERGGVDCLVTEDQDLHAPEVKEYLSAAGIRVLTVVEFLRALDAKAREGSQ